MDVKKHKTSDQKTTHKESNKNRSTNNKNNHSKNESSTKSQSKKAHSSRASVDMTNSADLDNKSKCCDLTEAVADSNSKQACYEPDEFAESDGYIINIGDDDDELFLQSKLKYNANQSKNTNKKGGETNRKGKSKEEPEDEEGEEANNMVDIQSADYSDDSLSISPSQSQGPDSFSVVKPYQVPSKVKKKLSKIIEDERGDDEAANTRAQNKDNDEDDNSLDNSLHNLDDEDSSDEQNDKVKMKKQKRKNAKGNKDADDKKAPDTNLIPKSPTGFKNSLTDGLNEMSAEELRQLKLLMGSQFNDIHLPAAEEAMPLSSHHRYEDDDDYMKRKLKNMQKREEQRKQNVQDAYEKKRKQEKIQRRKEGRAAGSDSDSSSDEDTEDELLRMKQEDIENGFDPDELKETFDGWEFYKKKKISNSMVYRYCANLDQDYMKNKITIVAHINHIYDLYLHQRRPFMRTYADLQERHCRIGSAHTRMIHFNGSNHSSGPSSYQQSSNQSTNQSSSQNQSNQSAQPSSHHNGQQRNKYGTNRGPRNYCGQQQGAHGKNNENIENVSTADSDTRKIGVMDPDVSNQFTQCLGYYSRQSTGIVYEKIKDDHRYFENYYYIGNDYLFDVRTLLKPIRKVFINFDKDIAHRMFGYRIRFMKKNMTMYAQSGVPGTMANQSHKPVHFYQKDKIKNVLDRYMVLKNYHSKQTVVKVLNSDNPEDRVEIEKNEKAILKMKNPINANPYIKKKVKNLTWYYGLDAKWQERQPSPPDNSQRSINYLKRTRFPHQKRFQSNTLRFSQKIFNNQQQLGQMLQIQNQVSTDSAGLPKTEKKMNGCSNLLFGSFGTLNCKDKLINSDQKVKPSQRNQQVNVHSDAGGAVTVNFPALQQLQQQLVKETGSVGGGLKGANAIDGGKSSQQNSTAGNEAQVLEYSEQSIQNINSTLEQLEHQKSLLQCQIEIHKQHVMHSELAKKEKLVLDHVQQPELQKLSCDGADSMNQLEHNQQAIQIQQYVSQQLNSSMAHQKSNQSLQNNCLDNGGRKQQEPPLRQSKTNINPKSKQFNFQLASKHLQQSQANQQQQNYSSSPYTDQFEKMSKQFMNWQTNQSQVSKISQGGSGSGGAAGLKQLQLGRVDDCYSQKDYNSTQIRSTPNTQHDNTSSSIRIQSGARCLNNSKMITAEESNTFNVQVLQSHMVDNKTSVSQLPSATECKEDVAVHIDDPQNQVETQANTANQNQPSNLDGVKEQQLDTPIQINGMQSSQSRPQLSGSLKMRQRGSQISMQSASQQVAFNVKQPRPQSKRKRQSTLCQVSSVTNYTAPQQPMLQHHCSFSSNQQKSLMPVQQAQRYKATQEVGRVGHHTGMLSQDGQNDLERLTMNHNKKQHRTGTNHKMDRDALPANNRQDHHNLRVQASNRNLNINCEPHSATNIQQSGMSDISPIMPFNHLTTTVESQNAAGPRQIEYQFRQSQGSSSPTQKKKIQHSQKQKEMKQDQKRQSTFTCYNNHNHQESRSNLMQAAESFGNSVNAVKGKNGLNEVYKLQGTSLLQGYSQQKNNYLTGQSASKQINHNQSQGSLNKQTAESGADQEPRKDANQDPASFKINLNKINEASPNANKTERYEQPQASQPNQQQTPLQEQLNQVAQDTIEKINQQRQHVARPKDLNAIEIKNSSYHHSQAKSCPRVDRSKRQIQSTLQDYAQDQTVAAINKFQIFRNKNIVQKTLDSRQSAEELQFAHQEVVNLVKQNNPNVDLKMIEEESRQRLHVKNHSMQDEIPRKEEHKRYSSHVKNKSEVVDHKLQREHFDKWVNHSEIDSQMAVSCKQDDNGPVSGEQTLKSRIPGHHQQKSHTRNGSLFETLNNNIKLQQQCIELFENNQQLLSQLRQYGRQQQHHFQLNLNTKHDNVQQLKEYYSDKKMVSTTINRSSQEELVSPLKINKKSNQLKSKNHQKQMSLGKGILYPKSYLEVNNKDSVTSQASSKLPEGFIENTQVCTERVDDRQSSVLFPNFLDQQDYKEKTNLPSCSSTTNPRGLNKFHQSLDRAERKICGVQNKIASMNGQIILNLNQSIFRNMHHQLLQKQLQYMPMKQPRALKMEPIQSPRKAPIMSSMPNYENKKLDQKIINEIKQGTILASVEQFDTNRSLQKSPNPKKSAGLNQGQNLQLSDLNKADYNSNPKSNLFSENFEDRKLRIQLTDVKKRREDSMDQHLVIQVERHSGVPQQLDNSPLIVQNSQLNQMKNYPMQQHIRNIFVETGQTLSTGATHINRQNAVGQPNEIIQARQVSSQPSCMKNDGPFQVHNSKLHHRY